MNTIDLLKRCNAQDRKAWEEFIRRYQSLIFFAIRTKARKLNCTITETEVDDLTQDLLLKLFRGRKLCTVKSDKALPYWLIIVTGNMTVDYLRSRIAKREVSLHEPVPRRDAREDDAVTGEPVVERTPREIVGGNEIKNLIGQFLAGLPSRDKIILELLCDHEKTHREIAELTHIPINTVSTVIRRTKERLREYADKKGIEIF